MSNAILLVHCPDQPGLVATVAAWIQRHRGNIVDLEQHVDAASDTFVLRAEWTLDGFALGRDDIGATFAREVGDAHAMGSEVYFTDERPRVALFVSRLSHCLYDLLSRVDAGELPMDVPVIVSNHDRLRPVADRFGIPYAHIPVTRQTKSVAEADQQRLLADHGVELVVLARYMQILSDGFVDRWQQQIINIHHSFLPAFAGARPYHRAFERGVKIVGATSHYVTADLDEGPIIAQDVVHVSHRDTVDDLVRKGRDTEKLVLARAVRAHIERRVLVVDGRTTVFG